MINRKAFFLIFLFIFSIAVVYAQESDIIIDNQYEADYDLNPLFGKKFEPAKSVKEFIESLDYIMKFSTACYVNPNKIMDGKIVSAPSPVLAPVTIGLLWPNYTFASMEPALSFFPMYHLWYGSMALPAEIENRTSTTFTFMLNLPVVFSFYFHYSRVQLKVGATAVMRFGLLSNGVNPQDPGYTGSAAGDMEKINTWFWDGGRFLYLSGSASWLFRINSKLKVGPEFTVYFPLGNMINNEGIQGMIADIGLKISL